MPPRTPAPPDAADAVLKGADAALSYAPFADGGLFARFFADREAAARARPDDAPVPPAEARELEFAVMKDYAPARYRFGALPGALVAMVRAAIAGRDRMEDMKTFFEGVGHGDTAGIWEGSPNLRPDFRAAHQKKLDNKAKAAKAEEMI
jgi:hypothetical protein